MNMISITGEVKHDLIDWSSIPEIYTKEEFASRSKKQLAITPKSFINMILSGDNERISGLVNLVCGDIIVYYCGIKALKILKDSNKVIILS